MITDGNFGGRKIYILPQWKEKGIQGGLFFALKQWNPDLLDGIEFEIFPQNDGPTIRLLIGADANEKLMLYYNSKLIKEKSAMHILPSGRWIEFWLQIRKGEIMLGYERVPTPLFQWVHKDFDFEPFFISYKSIQGNPIGIYFKCDECHTEISTNQYFTKVFPIGMWHPTDGEIRNNFTLKLRGDGDVIIPFMNMPRERDFFMITIQKRAITYTKVYYEDVTQLHQVALDSNLIFQKKWTDLYIEFTERSLQIIANNKTVFHFKNSKMPMLIYWFSVATRGWVTWTANCEPLDIDGPPLHGGWSEWSKWECSVSCGGGEGVRRRTCSNPRPNIYGKLCEGPHDSTGNCNEFPCGDISPSTIEKIRMRLRTLHFSYVIDENDQVAMANDRELLNVIKDESPDAYWEWTHNGLFIEPEEGRVSVREDTITITKTRVTDAGIYVCMVYRINGQRIVLRVITLAITTDRPTIKTRITLPLTLKSNALILGYIYSDLSQIWLIDDVIYKDYGITTLAAVNTEIIGSINKTHNGVWKCVITQKDLKLTWVTNWIKVEVGRAPNVYTHLMEDSLTAPLFSWMKYDSVILGSLIFIIVLIFGGVAFGLYSYFRWGTLPQRKPRYRKINEHDNE